MQSYTDALRLSLLFFRAQRSGDLSATKNPILYRLAPSFASDGSEFGIDLSRGYFDAGDYVKFGQPAAYTLAILAWSGSEFGEVMHTAGVLAELKGAVRWGTDFILKAASHLHHHCTYYAQVGRGAVEGCSRPDCKFDHGFWGRPEDYDADYPFAHQRRTYAINSTHPGIEIWASASAALAAAHILLRDDDLAYAAQLLGVSRALFECASDPAINPSDAYLQLAGLPEVSPQYSSFGFSDELGWASAWLYDATTLPRYLNAFYAGMRRGEDRWWYEGWAASWDDVS